MDYISLSQINPLDRIPVDNILNVEDVDDMLFIHYIDEFGNKQCRKTPNKRFLMPQLEGHNLIYK